ncbi:hypothetical protein C8Q79DRAFT_219108 [Trametes meyenii]|nr:hypothetical protein C8Q79DRAFT_219108 [Trametes meyenii]
MRRRLRLSKYRVEPTRMFLMSSNYLGSSSCMVQMECNVFGALDARALHGIYVKFFTHASLHRVSRVLSDHERHMPKFPVQKTFTIFANHVAPQHQNARTGIFCQYREHPILISHVWEDIDRELTFQDIVKIHTRAMREGIDPCTLVHHKIRMCCEIAERAGYEWVWPDTCCIAKTSSAELSEAINSMLFWYLSADICYAYLLYVSDHDDPRERGSSFRRSKYHKRGWTLQELIAPTSVIFLSRAWNTIGSKHSLLETLVETTGTDGDVLLGPEKMTNVSVAGRMPWAAKRETTRVEDRAYSLLGLFGISMPIIYGEGHRAFMRLQQEILKQDPDESLFAWGRIYPSLDAARDMLQAGPMGISVVHIAGQESLWDGLLAPNPDVFA